MIFDRKIGFEVKVTSLLDSSVEKILRKLYANSDEKEFGIKFVVRIVVRKLLWKQKIAMPAEIIVMVVVAAQ